MLPVGVNVSSRNADIEQRDDVIDTKQPVSVRCVMQLQTHQIVKGHRGDRRGKTVHNLEHRKHQQPRLS